MLDEKNGVSGMDEVGKILPAVFKPHVQRGEPAVAEILAPLWPRVVGKAMARQCRPAAFSRGTLTVVAELESWSLQLQQMEKEIRTEINAFLGGPVVRRLVVRQVIGFDAVNTGAPQAEFVPPEKSSQKWADRAADPKAGIARLAHRAVQKRFAPSFRKVD